MEMREEGSSMAEAMARTREEGDRDLAERSS